MHVFPQKLRLLIRLAVPSMRAIRLAVYSVVVFGMLAVVASRAVYADLREVGLGIGHQLAKLEDLTDGACLVRVNGAEVHWSSVRTSQSVDEVLTRYERHCRESPSALGQAMQDIPYALEDHVPLPKGDPGRSAIVREGDDDRGMVACFVGEEPAGGAAERMRRSIDAFAMSGDLSDLGRFRYVFAERGKHGTRVVTLWADGSLDLGRMFPAEGDAPGTDSSFAPRPEGSRRTMSAAVDGFPAAVRIYETRRTPEDILSVEDEALRAKGFAKVTLPDPAGGAAYVRGDGVEIILSTSRAAGVDAATTLVIVESSNSVRGVKVEKQP